MTRRETLTSIELVIVSEQVPARSRTQLVRKRANLDNFQCFQSHESRPLVLREALPDFGLDNLLNRGDIAVGRTANGLGESFFVFLLDN